MPQENRAPRIPGTGEGRGEPEARSRVVSRLYDTTSGPGRSPWGGGFRVAMIPPAACTEAVPTRPPLAPTLKTALGPGGSLWSLFYLLLLLLFLQASSPVPAPSSKRRAFRASAGQRGARRGEGGRQVGYQPARICGSCSQLPSATLVSHPSPLENFQKLTFGILFQRASGLERRGRHMVVKRKPAYYL